MLIALIQDAAPVAAPRLLPNVIMIAAFISIFYFLLLRPQRKIQQQHRDKPK